MIGIKQNRYATNAIERDDCVLWKMMLIIAASIDAYQIQTNILPNFLLIRQIF